MWRSYYESIIHHFIGIPDVLIGCYTFANPMILAISTGILIGIFFIETGFTMLFGGIAVND